MRHACPMRSQKHDNRVEGRGMGVLCGSHLAPGDLRAERGEGRRERRAVCGSRFAVCGLRFSWCWWERTLEHGHEHGRCAASSFELRSSQGTAGLPKSVHLPYRVSV